MRHLSPNGAHQLARHLASLDPTAVLIEGPSDATHLLEHFAHKKTVPPIALLAWARGVKSGPVRSVVYPFARYSPEWIAATWALSNKRLVRFIDLPATSLLALEPGAETPSTRVDPLTAIAQLAGETDHDTWWERHFEHASAEDAYRQSVMTLGAELRALDEASVASRENTLRESFMRRSIRQVLADGHEPARVLVVCGAFHASALTWELDAMSDGDARRLPKSDAALTLMPYGYFRMSTQGGNGAGNRAPAYFELLHDALRARTRAPVSSRFLSRVAVEMRRRGNLRSSAEVIEAVRLAEAMSALGGSPAPTLRDLHDAAVACLGGGDASVVRDAFFAVAVGDRVGELPSDVARTGLQDDFQRQLDALRLKDHVRDSSPDARSPEAMLVLDRRLNRQVKRDDAAARDRNRSVFLHRLVTLDLDFAKDITTAEDRKENTFKERWRLAWTPECEIRLVERALLGDSVEHAAERLLSERIDDAVSVGEATALALTARDCDLARCLDRAVVRVQALAVEDAGFKSVAGAVWRLARLIREPDVTGLDVSSLRPLLAQLFLRATLLVDSAARCDDAAAKPVGEAMDDVHRVSRYDWTDGDLSVDRWWAALDALAEDDAANPYVAGVSCALLIENGKVSDGDLATRVARRISPGMEPAKVAGWFEGLASRNPYALLSREGLWRSMTAFVESLDERAFRRALPGLRRAFSGFSAGESRAVAAAVAGVWASQKAPADVAVAECAGAVIDEVSDALEGIDFDL